MHQIAIAAVIPFPQCPAMDFDLTSLSSPAAPYGSASAILLMLLAVIIDAYVGGIGLIFRLIPHPLGFVSRMADHLDRRLNRPDRSQPVRLGRGAMVVLVIAATATATGLAVRFLTTHIAYGWVIEVILLSSLLSQRRTLFRMRRVRIALDERSLEAAREELRDFSRRDAFTLDRHAVARAAIETAARHFCDRAVAPLFWYAIAGLPGVFMLVAIGRLADRIAFSSDRYRAFGWTAGRVDRALKAVPARISGLMIAGAACFSPGGRPLGALKVVFTQAGRAATPAAGWTTAATAGALDLALGGPRRYPQAVVKEPWIGNGTAQALPVHIARAIWLLAIAALLNVLTVTGLVVARLSLPV